MRRLFPRSKSAGFEYLADLLYLSWETAAFAGQRTEMPQLQFEAYDESQRARLMKLVERTYEATQDCAAMNGKRPMEEVIDGYQGTGAFRPANWLFVRAEGEDVGVLLLADHPAARHWELMYMGLVPESAGTPLWPRNCATGATAGDVPPASIELCWRSTRQMPRR